MHLVVLRHTMDDLPLRLFDNLLQASEYASKVNWFPSEEVRDILHADCSTPCCICIVTFDNSGELESNQIVRSYYDEA